MADFENNFSNPLDSSDATNTPSQRGKPLGSLGVLFWLPIIVGSLFVWGILIAVVIGPVGRYLSRFEGVASFLFVSLYYLIAAFLIFGVPFIAIAACLIISEENAKRKLLKRDRELKARVDRARQSKDAGKPFGLLLRPFKTDFQLVIAKPSLSKSEEFSVLQGGGFSLSRKAHIIDDLLSNISNTLSRSFRGADFIVVGERQKISKSSFGSVVTADSEWKDVVLDLLDRASVIFLVPDITEGVRFEIQAVCNQHLAKTVFIQPPSYWYTVDWRSTKNGPRVSGHNIVWDDTRHSAKVASWSEVQSMFIELRKLEVPPSSPNGCLFWYDNLTLETCPIPVEPIELRRTIEENEAFGSRFRSLDLRARY